MQRFPSVRTWLRKPRPVIRLSFTAVILMGILDLAASFRGFERRMLIIEFTRRLVLFEIFAFEIFFARSRIARMTDRLKIAGKGVHHAVLVLALFMALSSLLSLRAVLADAHQGYRAFEVTVEDRSPKYNSYDQVRIQGNRGLYTLAPGYVPVEVSRRYEVHLFERTRIMIPVGEVGS